MLLIERSVSLFSSRGMSGTPNNYPNKLRGRWHKGVDMSRRQSGVRPWILRILWIAMDDYLQEAGGEGGIRTPGTLARTPHFECGAIDHSATSPGATAGLKRPPQGRRAA